MTKIIGRPAVPNAKYRPPRVAITKPMIDAGLAALKQIVDGGDEHTDDGLVAAVFYEMWNAYWNEMEATARKKAVGSPIVQRPSLILPGNP